jgi:hypothetical protein
MAYSLCFPYAADGVLFTYYGTFFCRGRIAIDTVDCVVVARCPPRLQGSQLASWLMPGHHCRERPVYGRCRRRRLILVRRMHSFRFCTICSHHHDDPAFITMCCFVTLCKSR